MSNSLPSEFTTTCSFCDAVSKVTLTGAHDELEVLCARCGTYLGHVGTLKADAEAGPAENAAATAQEGG